MQYQDLLYNRDILHQGFRINGKPETAVSG